MIRTFSSKILFDDNMTNSIKGNKVKLETYLRQSLSGVLVHKEIVENSIT